MERKNYPKYIIIHHSGGLGEDNYASTKHLTAEDINRAHRLRWPDFKSSLGWWAGYHYIVESSGKTTRTRDIFEEGAHTKGHNMESIGICLVGNFNKHPQTGHPIDKPTQEQENALRSLYGAITRQIGAIKPWNIVGHRYFSQTDCPGTGLPDNWARNTILDRATQLSIIQQMLAELVEALRKLKSLKLGGSLMKCEDAARD